MRNTDEYHCCTNLAPLRSQPSARNYDFNRAIIHPANDEHTGPRFLTIIAKVVITNITTAIGYVPFTVPLPEPFVDPALLSFHLEIALTSSLFRIFMPDRPFCKISSSLREQLSPILSERY